MADQLIPVTNSPNQAMLVSLNINDTIVKLNLTFSFNEMAQYWVMSVADVNNNPLIASVPLITGNWPAANILGQYQYLGIGSAYVINVSTGNVADYPGINDLGINFVLLWSDNVNVTT